jgi:hypothetical protein
MMTKPTFLIVGAMKAGTTTLYHDLFEHPDIFLPVVKEPDILVRYNDPEEIERAYATLFRAARKGQLRGEASTAYTKRPDQEGAAERARLVCGPELKIIYMRRDPIERIRSHYKHEFQHGEMAEPITEAIHVHQRLIDYTRYDWQIAPWIAAFGAGNVLQIDLEEFSANRIESLGRILRFIGADPARLPPVDPAEVSNRGDEQKHIRNPLLRAAIMSNFYQHTLRGLIPRQLRERARRSLLPPPEPAPADLDPESLAFIRQQLSSPAPGLAARQ